VTWYFGNLLAFPFKAPQKNVEHDFHLGKLLLVMPAVNLTLFKLGFLVWDWGEGSGGFHPLLSSENINAVTANLRRQIVRPKKFSFEVCNIS